MQRKRNWLGQRQGVGGRERKREEEGLKKGEEHTDPISKLM
jgi:hypothetical protein